MTKKRDLKHIITGTHYSADEAIDTKYLSRETYQRVKTYIEEAEYAEQLKKESQLKRVQDLQEIIDFTLNDELISTFLKTYGKAVWIYQKGGIKLSKRADAVLYELTLGIDKTGMYLKKQNQHYPHARHTTERFDSVEKITKKVLEVFPDITQKDYIEGLNAGLNRALNTR